MSLLQLLNKSTNLEAYFIFAKLNDLVSLLAQNIRFATMKIWSHAFPWLRPPAVHNRPKCNLSSGWHHWLCLTDVNWSIRGLPDKTRGVVSLPFVPMGGGWWNSDTMMYLDGYKKILTLASSQYIRPPDHIAIDSDNLDFDWYCKEWYTTVIYRGNTGFGESCEGLPGDTFCRTMGADPAVVSTGKWIYPEREYISLGLTLMIYQNVDDRSIMILRIVELSWFQ